MITSSISCKKLLSVLVLLVSGVLVSTCYGQNMKLKVSKDSTLTDGKYYYSIDIKIIGGKAPFKVELFDNQLSEGGKLITKEESTSQSIVHFPNLEPCRTLYISVECISERQGVTTLIKL